MAEADPIGVTVDAVLDWAWLNAAITAAGDRRTQAPTRTASVESGSNPGPGSADVSRPPSGRGREEARDRSGPCVLGGSDPGAAQAYSMVPEEVESVEQTGSGGARTTGLPVPAWLGRPPPPAAFVLPDRLELARLLRRLRHFGPAPESVVLDEDATAKHAAFTDLIVPVLNPARERWFELALVVDGSASIGPWRRLLAEFTRLVGGHGTFRSVRTWTLDTESAGGAVLRTPFGTVSPNAAPVGPAGRRIVMVISDGVGPAWSDPRTSAMLASWAGQCPVVFLNLLPRRWWDRSRIPFTPVVFRGHGVGPDRRSSFRLRHTTRWLRPSERVAIPVIGLHPDGLRPGDAADAAAGRWSEFSRWTRMITDDRGREFAHSAWVLDPRPSARDAEPVVVPAEDERSPRARLAEFRAGASPAAVELLGKLAAAPISLATMRVVQSTVLEAEDPAFAAEVFLSGLLVESAERDEHERGDNAEYDLDESVRETLLTAMSRRSALEVYFRVAEFVHDRLGHAEFDFQDLLTAREPATVGLIGPRSRSLARVGATLLYRLGPDYQHRASRLEARANGPMLRRRDLVYRWTLRMGDWIRARPIVLDDLILVQDTAGNLVGVDPLTGLARWPTVAGGSTRCAPVLTPGTVWTGTESGTVCRYDLAGGQAMSPPVEVGIGAVVALAPIGARDVLATTLDGGVALVDGADGRVRARPADGPGAPVGVCAREGWGAVLDRTGRARAWHLDRDPETPSWEVELSGAAHGAPMADHALVYVPLATRGITALRWDTGDIAWSTDLVGGVVTAPEPAAGRVLAATSDGFVYALDGASGEVLWRSVDVPQPELRVTAVGALVHVAGAGGGIRTYDADTGRRLAEIRSESGVFVAGGAHGQLILAGLDGTVTVLEGPLVVD